MAQWWEKRREYVWHLRKKVMMWKFYDAHMEKFIKKRSEQKIFSEESSGQMNDNDDKWKFDLVMKDELGIWNKGAEEEKIKPVEYY